MEQKHDKHPQVYEFTKEGRRKSASADSQKLKWSTTAAIILAVVCLLLLTAVIVLTVLLVQASSDRKDDDSAISSSDSVCMTEECVSAAARISSFIDHRVQPCDDFYQFACGSWLDNHVVQDDEETYDSISPLKDQVYVTIKNLLETDKHISDLRSFREARSFYRSCMNKTQIDFVNIEDLKILLHSLGDLPVVTQNWPEEKFNLNYVLTRLTQLRAQPLVGFTVAVDPRNASKKILKLGLGYQWYLPNHNDRKQYYTHLSNIINSLKNTADSIVDITDVAEFHKDLFQIMQKYSERRDQNRRTWTLADIHTTYSGVINWNQYLHGIFDATDNENILVESPMYVTELMDLVNKTRARTLANFLLLNFVYSFANKLGDKYKSIVMHDRETSDMYGVSDSTARYKFCIEETSMARGYAIASVFIKEKFDVSSRFPVVDMTTGIRTAFNESLKDIGWISETGKKFIREKNATMSVIIGYPDVIAQRDYPDKYYTPYNFDEKAFFNNSVEVRRAEFNKKFKNLQAARNINESLPLPHNIGAGYRLEENQLYATAAVFQPPIFHKNYPNYLIYGTVGAVFGINIIQGFHQPASDVHKSDGSGNQFFTYDEKLKYRSSTRCFVNQFGQVVDPETGINFNSTVLANKGNVYSAGVRLGYKAYRAWQVRQGKGEQTLPGLKYSQDQLFFLTFAQLMCEKRTKQTASSQIHISTRFLLNAAYQNSPELSQAFKCSPNSLMNPRNKCAVWSKSPPV